MRTNYFLTGIVRDARLGAVEITDWGMLPQHMRKELWLRHANVIFCSYVFKASVENGAVVILAYSPTDGFVDYKEL